MWILVICGVLLIFTVVFLRKSKPKINLPPNIKDLYVEKGWPIVGIIFQISGNMYKYFFKLSNEHGPIFYVRFGRRNMLVLNNYEWLKKCLKDDGDNFSGRPVDQLIKRISHNSGLIFKDGEVWSKSRSFALRVLRDFGLGKSKSQEIVLKEVDFLIEDLRSRDGKSIKFAETMSIYTLNIISKFLMNRRFEKNDETVKLIKYIVLEVIKQQGFQYLPLMFPSLEQSSWFTAFLVRIFKHQSTFDKVHDIFRKEIERHREIIGDKVEVEDMMDCFLQEQQTETTRTPIFDDWQLIRMSFELFIAGYETTSTAMLWAVMFLARFPDLQESLAAEVAREVGTQRQPIMADKLSLPRTQAFMDEVMRMAAISPLAALHRTLANSIVGDEYFIPANTVVITNLFGCMRDPTVWERPEHFYPSHFLHESPTPEGGTSCEYRPREELLVFGIGKRQCLGESLARMEYFLFLVTILQHFRVQFDRPVTDTEYEAAITGPNQPLRTCSIDGFCFIER